MPDIFLSYMFCLAKSNRWHDARESVRRLRDTDPGMPSSGETCPQSLQCVERSRRRRIRRDCARDLERSFDRAQIRMRPGSSSQTIRAPAPPDVRLSLGIAGHREDNPAFAANRDRIQATVDEIFDAIAAALAFESARLAPCAIAPVRLHSMLAEGADQLAAERALARGWELVSPLPFGRALNTAINAFRERTSGACAIGGRNMHCEGEVGTRAKAIRALSEQARTFELADADEMITELFSCCVRIAWPRGGGSKVPGAFFSARGACCTGNDRAVRHPDRRLGRRVASLHRWHRPHALRPPSRWELPVIWIDAKAPESWRIVRAPESLALLAPPPGEDGAALLATLVHDARCVQRRAAMRRAPMPLPSSRC